MNIKITEAEHEFLLKHHTGKSVTIGSHMYGVNNSNSDKDVLMFYKSPWPEEYYPNIHQFQYTEGKADFIWTTEEQFWKNQRSGDSTINSDVLLFSQAFIINDDQERINCCRTYKVIKAYIGFAKRDIKYAKEGKHKLLHAYRSLYCADQLLQGKLPTLKFIGINIYNIAYAGSAVNMPDLLEFLKKWEAELRALCNKMYENKAIEMYYIDESGDTLLNKLLQSNNTREFRYE